MTSPAHLKDAFFARSLATVRMPRRSSRKHPVRPGRVPEFEHGQFETTRVLLSAETVPSGFRSYTLPAPPADLCLCRCGLSSASLGQGCDMFQLRERGLICVLN